ncbi:hypothetical protein ACFO9E_25075 [Streptomyces maoxianensis]|uniref:Uncharacterized protein n=1 Tax=Streptomyces maoxianensis TaxID=1459942 RepID=A0ABV9G9S9_9ACTN
MADVADAPVDCFGADIEEGSDGDLGQGVSLVEDCGQQPVGESEDRAAPGAAVTFDAWAVAASFVQFLFALVLVECGQRGDDGPPVDTPTATDCVSGA